MLFGSPTQTFFRLVTQSPSPRTSVEAKGTFLARVPITAADFAPKTGWRSRENYFRVVLALILCNRTLIVN